MREYCAHEPTSLLFHVQVVCSKHCKPETDTVHDISVIHYFI